jgi:hypothetical protein
MSICDSVISVFKQCDTSNLGIISVDAFKSVLISLEHGGWTATKVDQLLIAFGLGNASSIHYEDFFRWLFSDRPVQSLQESQGQTSQSKNAPDLGHRDAYKTALPPPAIDPAKPLGAALLLPDVQARAAAVDEVLRSEPGIATTVNSQGKLPLHLALRSGQPRDVVQLLLRANPDGAAVQDNYGSLPLHIALSTGGTAYETIADVLEAFLAGASVEDKASGMLPLHSVLMRDAPALPATLVKALLEANPAAILAKSQAGDSPMKLAMYFDRGPAVMEELLKTAWKAKLSQ